MANFRKLNGTWQARISYKDSAGKFHQKTKAGFINKRDAAKWANEQELFLKDGMDKTKILVTNYFDNWYKVFKQPHIEERTILHYQGSSKVIKTYFGNTKIGDLSEESVQKFINAYGNGETPFNKPHAKETVSKILTHFKGALRQAVSEGIFRVNPAEKTHIVWGVQPKSEETKFLGEKDQQRLRNYILKNLDPYVATYYLILTGLDTGMRPGELLGLTWDNIDMKKNLIHIVKTWNPVKNGFGPVKNNKPRTVTITPYLVEILKQLKEHQLADLAFATERGVPMSTENLSKMVRKIQRRAGIEKPVNPHGLRHSHASLMLYHGMNVKALSKRLGHQNIQITLNTYAHVIDEMETQQNEIVKETIEQQYKSMP